MCFDKIKGINALILFMQNIWKGMCGFFNLKNKIKYHGELPYYFTEYKKHVTVYKNGNGIIIHSAKLVVTDKNKLDYIYRKINIRDGKKDSVFPKLEEMLSVEKIGRFDNYGFWWYSDDEIIKSIDEFYWSDEDPTKEDADLKENEKELRWRFRINKSKIEENKEYNIIYAISVCGLYPIVDGYLEESLVNQNSSKEQNASTVCVAQDIEKFTFVVSFEEGIELKDVPECELRKHIQTADGNEVMELCRDQYNIFYNEYVFNIDKPMLESIVRVHWKFKKVEKS